MCVRSRCDLDQHQLVFRIGEEPLTASLLCLCAVHVLPASLRALRQRAIATWNAIELQELWIIRNEVAPASIKRRGVPLLKLGWWLLILEAHVENSSEPGKSGSPQSTCSCFLQKRLILFTKRVLIGKLHIATGVVEIRHHPELCVEVGSKYTNRDMTLTERRTVPRPYNTRHQKRPDPSGKALPVLLVLLRRIG